MPTVPTILGDVYVEDEGDGEAVALLWPSLFTDHTMWRYQLPALHAAGWRTLALDPPGHGKSDGVDRVFAMDECTDVAIAVLDASKVRSPVVMFGTSWGGMIAPRLAMRAPERLRGMVLFNTTAERAAPFERVKNVLLTKMFAAGALDTMVDRMLLSLQLSPETRRRTPELAVELATSFRSWNRRRVIETIRSVLVERDATLDALSSVTVPALVVSGKEDTILPSEHSAKIAATLRSARHVEVPGAAHLVPLEVPEAANALIHDFLATLPHA